MKLYELMYQMRNELADKLEAAGYQEAAQIAYDTIQSYSRRGLNENAEVKTITPEAAEKYAAEIMGGSTKCQ